MSLQRLLRQPAARPLLIMKIRAGSLAAKFLLTLFIARFMGFEPLGLYGLITAATIWVPVALGLGITYVLSRRAVTQTPAEMTAALRQYGRLIAALYVVVLAASVVAGLWLNMPVLAVSVALIILFEHVQNDMYQLLLNLSRPLAANVLHFVRTGAWMGAFMVLAFLLPALRTMDALLAFWIGGQVLAALGFAFVTRDWPWRAAAPAPRLDAWVREEFAQSRTLYINNIANTAATYLDRYLITFFLGLELTGVYVFFWSISSALSNLIYTGIIQVSRPKLVQACKRQDPAWESIYNACLRHTLMISVAMALGAGAALWLGLPYLNKPQAVEWFPAFLPILAAFIMGARGEAQNLIFYSLHRDDLTLRTSLAMLASACVFDLALIPFLSLWGAALASVLVAGVRLWVQGSYIGSLSGDGRGSFVTEGS